MFHKKSKTNPYASFWGVKEVYHGICASRECSIISINAYFHLLRVLNFPTFRLGVFKSRLTNECSTILGKIVETIFTSFSISKPILTKK